MFVNPIVLNGNQFGTKSFLTPKTTTTTSTKQCHMQLLNIKRGKKTQIKIKLRYRVLKSKCCALLSNVMVFFHVVLVVIVAVITVGLLLLTRYREH